jgi:hypothetical protein
MLYSQIADLLAKALLSLLMTVERAGGYSRHKEIDDFDGYGLSK